MTCIAAIAHDGEVTMAGDSAVTNEAWDMALEVHPKVFRRGEVLIGGTGRSRFLNIVEHGFAVPPIEPGRPLMGYVASDFVAALREALRTAGHLGHEDSGLDKVEGDLLIGVRGKIIRIGGDFYVSEARSGYFAIGSGDELALGSLHATAGRIDDPMERLMLALAAAECHKASVRRPFVVLGPEGFCPPKRL